MKKVFSLLAAVSLLILTSCDKNGAVLTQDSQSFVKTIVGNDIPGQYVVLLKDGATSTKSAIQSREPLEVYNALTEGFAVKLSVGEAASLKNNNKVLGGSIYEPLNLKVLDMGAKGIFFALAAGNESDDANNHSPARAEGPDVYTISACDVNDNWASFSNYGNPPIEYCAPGVSILSTYKGGVLATRSGISMASPHSCEVLLATGGNPTFLGYVNNDPDGEPDSIIHK